MNNDQLTRVLTDMGDAATPAPSAQFADALEERLRTNAYIQHSYVIDRWPVRPRRRVRLAVVPVLGALLAVGAGVYALTRGEAPRPQLSTGAPETSERAGTASTSPTTTATNATTIDTMPDPAGAVAPAVAPTRTAPMVTEPPVATPRTEPAPGPTSTTAPVESTRPPSTRATTTTARRGIELSAVRTETIGGVKLQWTAFPGAARYVVIRTTSSGGAAPPEPVYPAAAPTTVVFETASLLGSDTVEPPVTAVRYRVIALDAAGRVLMQSPFAQLSFTR